MSAAEAARGLNKRFCLRVEVGVADGGDEFVVPLSCKVKAISHAEALHTRRLILEFRVRSECLAGRNLQEADGVTLRENAVVTRDADTNFHSTDIFVGIRCQGEHRGGIRRCALLRNIEMQVLYACEVGNLRPCRVDGEGVILAVRVCLHTKRRSGILDGTAEDNAVDLRAAQMNRIVVSDSSIAADDRLVCDAVLDVHRTDVDNVPACCTGAGLSAVDVVRDRAARDGNDVLYSIVSPVVALPP